MNEQRKRKVGWALAVLAAVLVLVAVVVQWNRWKAEQQPFTSTEFAMGSYVQQTVYGDRREEAASEAANAVQRLENQISWRIEGSDIARLNEAAGTDWIAIDPQTAELLAQALDVAERSNGAYDPTILPVSSLWDFGGENQHLPEAEQIEEYRSCVGYQNLRVDEQASEASLKTLVRRLISEELEKAQRVTLRFRCIRKAVRRLALSRWAEALAYMGRSRMAACGA